MTYKTLLSIALGLGLATGTSVALADEPVTDTLNKPLGTTDDAAKSKPASPSKGSAADGSQKVSFGALDVNTDRKLSRDEVKTNAALSADFDKLDADRNGALSDGEFARFEDTSAGKKDDKSAGDKAKDDKERTKDKAQDERDRAKDRID